MIKLKKLYITLSLIASGFAISQTNPAAQLPQNAETLPVTKEVVLSPKEKLEININKMMTDPALKNANWGFVVYDPKTEKVISSYNENTPLIPASTTKLLTTETAMAILGGQYKWKTQLEYSGTIESDGTLNGNIFLIGSGDPVLGTGKAGSYVYREIITEFITKLAEAGIKKVNGDIVIQTAIFKNNVKDLPANVVWLEHNNYFLPAGTTKDIDPSKERLTIKQINPFEKEKRYFYVSPYINKMVFASEYKTSWVTTKLPDGPAFLGNNIRASMIKSGMPVTGKVISRVIDGNPEDRTYVTHYDSPPLSEIVYHVNQVSDNAVAESILKTVGFQKYGDMTIETGKKTITEHLTEKGYDFQGLNLADGSGLSRTNSVTPIAQVKYLSALMKEKYFNEYLKSLPVAGQSGTLKRMFNYSTAYGQIYAKTGTLNKVKTLAGYIKTRTGKTLAFSLLINNYVGSVDLIKQKMEQILEPTIDL